MNSSASDCSVAFTPDHRAGVYDDEGQKLIDIQDKKECMALVDALLTMARCFTEVGNGRHFNNTYEVPVAHTHGEKS